MMKSRKTFAIAAATALATTALAPAALAQDSSAPKAGKLDATSAQYDDALTDAERSAGGGAGTSAGAASGGADGGGGLGSLPFTGTDLITLASIALCLVATGVLLQSLSRPRKD
jgi:hypothetical protein